MGAADATRRRFLRESAALAGLAVGTQSVDGLGLGAQGAAPAAHPMAYGQRSRFVTTVRTPSSEIPHNDLHGNPNGLDALTPLGELTGTITPSALHYVSSHGNVPPDIDPAEHRLLVYGMVDRPLVFTLPELKRLPSVSRIHYIECVANAPHPRGTTLEQMHGMIGCSEWTGVPLSVLLNEVGLRAEGSWVFAEGAEATKLGASIPMGKAVDDVLVAYGQNGEPIRPNQGYPLRLVVPGFQGKYHVKWLRRLRVVDRPYMSYWEKHSYMKRRGPRPRNSPLGHINGAAGSYFLEQGPKSVITFPAAGQRLTSHGFYTVSGLAWSGCGAVRRVEVSTDGGRTWADAEVEGPARRIALARFTMPWRWSGEDVVLQSRCTDDRGQVQPTAAEHDEFWGTSGAPHGNSIQPWRVTRDGTVHNALLDTLL